MQNKLEALQLALPTLNDDAHQIVKGGCGNGYEDWWNCDPSFSFWLDEVVITPGDSGSNPGGGYDPYWPPFYDPFYDPYDYGDPYDGGGSSGGSPSTPSTPSYYGGTAEGIDIANGDATAAEANAYYNKFSDATTALGITAGVQGLKYDALGELVKATTGETGTIKTLSRIGKAWGIVGVAVGSVDLYYAFADGDVSNSDIINTVGFAFGVVGLVASGPVGWIAGGISLGIAIYSAASGSGSSGGSSGGGGSYDPYGY